MTAGTASNLDIEKFRKVRALMERGSTVGERQAARSRAEFIAGKAGIDLKAAIKEDDRLTKQQRSTSQNSWAPRYEREEAAKKRAEEARWEAYWAEESKKRQAKFDEAVSKYGPAESVFAETPEELRLRTFLEPYQTSAKFSNSDETYVDGFTGWGKQYHDAAQAAFRKLLNEAIPFPTNLPDLIAEWKAWDELRDRRYEYDGDYEMPKSVYARTDVLEHMIRITSVRNWTDMDVRLKWMRDELGRNRWRDHERDLMEFERLKSDVEFLRSISEVQNAAVKSRHRSNSEKADAVKALLREHSVLSDREIARRAGVSVQTACNWRKRLREHAG